MRPEQLYALWVLDILRTARTLGWCVIFSVSNVASAFVGHVFLPLVQGYFASLLIWAPGAPTQTNFLVRVWMHATGNVSLTVTPVAVAVPVCPDCEPSSVIKFNYTLILLLQQF